MESKKVESNAELTPFEKDFKAASGNMIHEGMKCNDEEKELIRLKYLGKITEEEFIKRVLDLAMK